MTRRNYFTDRQIVEALRQAAGMQSIAAELLRKTHGRPCSRTQLNNRIMKSERLRAEIDAILEEDKDYAEAHLKKALRAGAPWAITFFLPRKAKDRGYGNTVEQTGPGGGPQQHVVKVVRPSDVRTMTDDQIEDFIREQCSGPGAN